MNRVHSTSGSKGFSLVELCLAIGLIAFSLLALMGLFMVGLSSAKVSREETTAAWLAMRCLGEARAEYSFTGALPGTSTVQFFDRDGTLTDTDESAFFRTEIQRKAAPSSGPLPKGVHAVLVNISWPQTPQQTNAATGSFHASTLVTTRRDTGWRP